MLAAEDCQSYWQRVDLTIPVGERASAAFEQRWFGTKSEARVRTIMTDMIERFDAFPEALALLRRVGAIPSPLRRVICHLHTQLADPLYRQFTGDLLPLRRSQGYSSIDREVVARWVGGLEPGRWSLATCMKFAGNMLSTAFEAGLVSGRRDPRSLGTVSVPDVVLGYVLYLLRSTTIEGTLTDNPYLRSLGISSASFVVSTARVPGIRVAQLGGAVDVTWLEPSLMDYGMQTLKKAQP
jgi:hypothetical protein